MLGVQDGTVITNNVVHSVFCFADYMCQPTAHYTYSSHT